MRKKGGENSSCQNLHYIFPKIIPKNQRRYETEKNAYTIGIAWAYIGKLYDRKSNGRESGRRKGQQEQGGRHEQAEKDFSDSYDDDSDPAVRGGMPEKYPRDR